MTNTSCSLKTFLFGQGNGFSLLNGQDLVSILETTEVYFAPLELAVVNIMCIQIQHYSTEYSQSDLPLTND